MRIKEDGYSIYSPRLSSLEFDAVGIGGPGEKFNAILPGAITYNARFGADVKFYEDRTDIKVWDHIDIKSPNVEMLRKINLYVQDKYGLEMLYRSERLHEGTIKSGPASVFNDGYSTNPLADPDDRVIFEVPEGLKPTRLELEHNIYWSDAMFLPTRRNRFNMCFPY
ncbi:hypothetical protein [Natroniella sp. ANB-PHB2]|uniref:hypothetical protein n=1 Tax=Natroniella sp. ANB-PHB2 TaxID=3384444 RepID=UPI0038D379E1